MACGVIRIRGVPAVVGAGVVLTAAMLVTPATGRRVLFVLVTLCALLPVLGILPRLPRGQRLPWVLLGVALGLVLANNLTVLIGGDAAVPLADLLVSVGNAHMLAAAVLLVLRRGRSDIGGVLDVTLVSLGAGGLLWTTVLLPRLRDFAVPVDQQIVLLATVLLLFGVLGAMTRLWLADGRAPVLKYFAAAVAGLLAADIAMITATGATASQAAAWYDAIYVPSYVFLGLAVLDPSASSLARPGHAPQDTLSTGRLLFLGGALGLAPCVAGIREIAGLQGDGVLLALQSLLVVPLVMLRIGWLGRQRERAERRLRHQATHDLLTGLPNRAELWSRLDAALDAERRAGRPGVVLLFCDLNGFKAVNDRLGHLAGDRLLTEVAARIRAGLRAGDTLARYGGDEFVLLCEEPGAQEEAADRLAGHVHDALGVPVTLSGEQVTVSASVGVVLSAGGAGADELIRRADERMYAHKAARSA